MESNIRAPVFVNLLNSLQKSDKMLCKPRILSFFLTRSINSIKHEHLCKILYYMDQLLGFGTYRIRAMSFCKACKHSLVVWLYRAHTSALSSIYTTILCVRAAKPLAKLGDKFQIINWLSLKFGQVLEFWC